MILYIMRKERIGQQRSEGDRGKGTPSEIEERPSILP